MYVYALRSLSRNYHYVGMTKNIDDRLRRHSRGLERTTRAFRPFKLLFLTEVDGRREARLIEIYFKGGSGKEFLKSLK